MKNRINRILAGAVTLGAMFLTGAAHAAPSATIVSAKQHWPWNGNVDIVVNAADLDPARVYALKLKLVDGETDYTYTTGVELAGVTATNGLALVVDAAATEGWDASPPRKMFAAPKLLPVLVESPYGGVQLWKDGPYWAECNVGASQPEASGYYFWWGDTVGYARSGGTRESYCYSDVTWVSSAGKSMGTSPFLSSDCPTWNKDDSTLQSEGFIDSSGNLVAEYDAATAHLGAPWRMPTDTELVCLYYGTYGKTSTVWTNDYAGTGIAGYVVTGTGDYGGRSIFLPAVGFGYGNYLQNPDSGGYYGSSTQYSGSSEYARDLEFRSNDISHYKRDRSYGLPVRPVRDPGPEYVGVVFADLPRLDTREEITIPLGETVGIAYSESAWSSHSAGSAVIQVNMHIIASGLPGNGTYSWTPPESGDFILEHSPSFLSKIVHVLEPVEYLDWDDETKTMTNAVCRMYETVTAATDVFEDGTWYVVTNGADIASGSIKVNGCAHLILCDGGKLKVELNSGTTAGIQVSASGAVTNSLAIYGQALGTGELVVRSSLAGIGGGFGEDGGMVTINGGTVTATGHNGGAGIGGGNKGAGGTVTINGGTVTADSGTGAGIGGGYMGNGGMVTVNGGLVTATGMASGGYYASAGIGGGGNGGKGGQLVVNGGKVIAVGGGVLDGVLVCSGIGHGEGASDEGSLTLAAGLGIIVGADRDSAVLLEPAEPGRGAYYETVSLCTVTVGGLDHAAAVWVDAAKPAETNAVVAGKFNVVSNHSVTLVVTADEGYYIKSNGEAFTTLAKDLGAVTASMTVNSLAVKALPAITYETNYEGAGTATGPGSAVPGETVTVVAAANENWQFKSWSGEDEEGSGLGIADSSEPVATFTAKFTNMTVTANFKVSEVYRNAIIASLTNTADAAIAYVDWIYLRDEEKQAYADEINSAMNEQLDEISGACTPDEIDVAKAAAEAAFSEIVDRAGRLRVQAVSAAQHAPWNGLADIDYTVVGVAQDGAGVWVTVTSGGVTKRATTLAGDVSGEPGEHRMTWNFAADWPDLDAEDVQIEVGVGAVEGAKYCVIDLSGGKDAASYPVKYLFDSPEGGFNIGAYKTDKLVLKFCPAGSFIMGDDQANESHHVAFTKPFYLGLFETTQKQWKNVTGLNPAHNVGDTKPVNWVSYEDIRGAGIGTNWPAHAEVDATSFLGKLRTKTGLAFDLPTEAQWEYACRAGTTTTNSFGDAGAGDYMWCQGISEGLIHEVGTKLANPWGVYDMYGNVAEWCLDWWGGNPVYGDDPRGPLSGLYRMSRGGNSDTDAKYCTSSERGYCYAPSLSGPSCGFRLARTLSALTQPLAQVATEMTVTSAVFRVTPPPVTVKLANVPAEHVSVKWYDSFDPSLTNDVTGLKSSEGLCFQAISNRTITVMLIPDEGYLLKYGSLNIWEDTSHSLPSFGEYELSYSGITVIPVSAIVCTLDGKRYTDIEYAIDECGKRPLSDIVVLDPNAPCPEGYVIVENGDGSAYVWKCKDVPAARADLVYTGTAQLGFDSTNDAVYVAGEVEGVTAGVYSATFAAPTGYAWSTGKTNDVTVSFMIAPAPLVITAGPKTIVQGDELANDGVTYAGFVNGEDENVLAGTLGYDYSCARGGATGDYAITPKGLSSGNYALVFSNGTLTVVARQNPTISDVTARQRWPWSGAVEIGYTVGDDAAGGAVSLWAVALCGEEARAATNLTGGVSSAPGTRVMAWDAPADWPGLESKEVRIHVGALVEPGVMNIEEGNSRVIVDCAPCAGVSGFRAEAVDPAAPDTVVAEAVQVCREGLTLSGLVNGRTYTVRLATYVEIGGVRAYSPVREISATPTSTPGPEAARGKPQAWAGPLAGCESAPFRIDGCTVDTPELLANLQSVWNAGLEKVEVANETAGGTEAWSGADHVWRPATGGVYAFTKGAEAVKVMVSAALFPVAVPPSAVAGLVYTGAEQTGIDAGAEAVLVEGVTAGTAAGEYAATFRPRAGASWTDGSETNVTVSFTIAKKPLRLLAEDVTIVYGEVPHGNGVIDVDSAFVEGEDFLNLGGELVFDFRSYIQYDDVGTYMDEIVPDGYTSANYAITYVPGTLTVLPKTLTIDGIVATDRDYDGSAAVGLTGGTLVGLENGDKVSFALGTGSATSASAGEVVTVAVGEIALTGEKRGNYVLAEPEGGWTTSVKINRKSLSIEGLEAMTRPYDGTCNVVLTNGTLVGAVGGDDVVAVIPPTGEVEDANVGAGKVVSFDEIMLEGAAAANYVLVQPEVMAEIVKAELTLTAEDKVCVAGDDPPQYTFIVDGFVNGDDTSVFAVSPEISCAYTKESAIDEGRTFDIVISGAEAYNYVITFVNGTLTVKEQEPIVDSHHDMSLAYDANEGVSIPAVTLKVKTSYRAWLKASEDTDAAVVGTVTFSLAQPIRSGKKRGQIAVSARIFDVMNKKVSCVKGRAAASEDGTLSVKLYKGKADAGDSDLWGVVRFQGDSVVGSLKPNAKAKIPAVIEGGIVADSKSSAVKYTEIKSYQGAWTAQLGLVDGGKTNLCFVGMKISRAGTVKYRIFDHDGTSYRGTTKVLLGKEGWAAVPLGVAKWVNGTLRSISCVLWIAADGSLDVTGGECFVQGGGSVSGVGSVAVWRSAGRLQLFDQVGASVSPEVYKKSVFHYSSRDAVVSGSVKIMVGLNARGKSLWKSFRINGVVIGTEIKVVVSAKGKPTYSGSASLKPAF